MMLYSALVAFVALAGSTASANNLRALSAANTCANDEDPGSRALILCNQYDQLDCDHTPTNVVCARIVMNYECATGNAPAFATGAAHTHSRGRKLFHARVPMSGVTLNSGIPILPGFYDLAAGIGLTSRTLKLEVPPTNGHPVYWDFSLNKGAFTTAADTEVVFVQNGVAIPTTVVLSQSVNWRTNGAITLGANSHMIGRMETASPFGDDCADKVIDTTTTVGAITLGAGATSGFLSAPNGAVNLGARATSDTIVSGAAITMGANAVATCTGNDCVALNAGGAISMGDSAIVIGNIEAGYAINLGANSRGGFITAGAAITMGAGATCDALYSGAAITMGANAIVNGQAKAKAAINVGAGARSCGICAGAAITVDAKGKTDKTSSCACPLWPVSGSSFSCAKKSGDYTCG